MTENELQTIFSLESAAIIAPAGHGKTEMLVDMVNYSSKKVLLLTHTNAGVSAIKKRLKTKAVPSAKYEINTIASFCNKWSFAYKNTSQMPNDMSCYNAGSLENDYYDSIYNGTKLIFNNTWALKVLKETYYRIIVDEYQDCNIAQHNIFLAINKAIPVIVLGDPLQGIFDFNDAIVDFNNLVFNKVPVKTKPWRWINSKTSELGDYLSTIRGEIENIFLLDNSAIDIKQNEYVEIISEDKLYSHDFLSELDKYNSVVYITKWEPRQLEFSKKTKGFFQHDETIMCKKLFKYAELFDSEKDSGLILKTIDFASTCMTNVKVELKEYITRIKKSDMDFADIEGYKDFADIITKKNYVNNKYLILDLLNWFKNENVFKKYRCELLYEMIRSVQYSIDNNISIYDAALRIRTDVKFHRDYNGFKRLSSRTLLCKGLEFECAIINVLGDDHGMTAKDFYVAMTRATKKIYILTNDSHITFIKNKPRK